MLHEILLSLSGQPSPLFDTEAEATGVSQGSFPLLSPPEKALLTSLARLSRLHVLLRVRTSQISSSHSSTICRAVSTSISTEQLGKFQKQILEVEKAVLSKDSSYVGGYGIVPLASLVGEFAPWNRRLEWLWAVVSFMLPESSTSSGGPTCSGASLIDYLRKESQTGFLDLEGIARDLIRAAETAWMKQLSMWLLYGDLPAFGKEDFFIQTALPQDDEEEHDANGTRSTVGFMLRVDLLPRFVSPVTASSILFIGKSLNHIKGRNNQSQFHLNAGSSGGVILDGVHLQHLAALKSPISSSDLSNAVSDIRLSLSHTALSKLLPLPKILEILSLMHNFFFLIRGEFAMALVFHADARLRLRNKQAGALRGLEGVVIKDGEIAATLGQTWTELSSLQDEADSLADELEFARELLQLTVSNKKGGRLITPSRDIIGGDVLADISHVSFDDLLFPASTKLSLKIKPPFDLFLANPDIAVYSVIHSYLLGIRRAQIHLSSLWKQSSMRRCHPAPWGPPKSNTRGGEARLRAQRHRQNQRAAQMRSIWATVSASIFVLSELGGYLQGEVVAGSWEHFRHWLDRTNEALRSEQSASLPVSHLHTDFSRPQTAHSRPQTANSSSSLKPAHLAKPLPISGPSTTDLSDDQLVHRQPTQHDPESLTIAHRRYLGALAQALFLTDVPYTSALRSFLNDTDHLVGLVSRLETVQQNLDLEADEGVVDALADYARDEHQLLNDLGDAREAVEEGMKDIIARLRDIDDTRAGEGRKGFDYAPMATTRESKQSQNHTSVSSQDTYVPRKAAGVDRLLMKLDFSNLSDNIQVTDNFDDHD